MRLLALFAFAMLAGCWAQPEVPKGSREASKADAERLQVLANKACECTRQGGKDEWWEPIAYQDKNYTEAPSPPCWQDFAEALRPYAFENPPVAACGPGSDGTAIVVGRDRGQVNDVLGAAERKASQPPELFWIILSQPFGTCTSAQAAKAKAEYEARTKRRTCG